MANTFKIEGEFILTDKGTLKAVGKKAKTASESMDKVSKSSASADRNIKGVAQASSNATKNFSKMSQGISGDLVRSYAILAANVFALTAVFNSLREASQLNQLREGLEFVGRAAGANLPKVASQLQEISGGAITAAEAMRSVAIGISAGFSPDQIQSLTKVAKGASIALGRDMTDALNRLTRGAAKLEPELLDELGIMARLEEATTKYATTINKTAGELTTFERSQAFLNEIIEQGELKFGQIANSVDPDPYQRLAAAFNDLKIIGLQFLNTFVTPLISFLGGSKTGLLGVLLVFSSTITKQLVPAIAELGTTAAKKAETFADSVSEAFGEAAESSAKFPKSFNNAINSMEQLPEGFKKFSIDIAKGNYQVKDLEKSLKSLKLSNAGLAKASSEANKTRIAEQRVIINLIEQEIANQKILNSTLANKAAAQAASISRLSQRESTIFATLGDSTLGKIDKTKKVFKDTTAVMSAHVKEAIRVNQVGQTNNKVFSSMNKVVGATVGVTRAASVGFKVLGASITGLIPVIGQALFLFSILQMAWDFFKKDNPIKKASEEALESLKDLTNAETQLASTLELIDSKLADTNDKEEIRLLEAQKITAQYNAQAGALSSVTSAITTVTQAQRAQNLENLRALRTELRERERKAEELRTRYSDQQEQGGFFFNRISISQVQAAEGTARLTRESYEGLLNTMKEVSEETKSAILTNLDYAESLGLVTDKKGIQALRDELNKTNPSLREVERLASLLGISVKNLDSIFSGAAQEGSKLKQTLLELGGQSASKVTPLVEAFKSIKNNIDSIIASNTEFDINGIIKSQDTEKLTKELDAYLVGLGFSAEFLEEKLGGAFSKESVEGFLDELLKVDESLKSSKLELESSQAILGALAKDKDKDLQGRKKYLDQEEQVRKAKIAQLESEKSLYKVTLTEAEAAVKVLLIDQKIKVLKSEQLTTAERLREEQEVITNLVIRRLSVEKDIASNSLIGVERIRAIDSLENKITREKLVQLGYQLLASSTQEETNQLLAEYDSLLSSLIPEWETTLKIQKEYYSQLEKSIQLHEQEARLAEKISGYSKDLISAEETKLRNATIRANLDKGLSEKITPEQELEIFNKLRASREATIKKEKEIKDALITSEFLLEELKYKRLLEETRLARTKSTDVSEQGILDDQIRSLETIVNPGGLLDKAKQGAKEANQAAADAAIDTLNLDNKLLRKSVEDYLEASSIFAGAKKSLQDNLSGSFKSIIDGTKSAKEAFKDLALTILDSISDIAAANLSKALVGDSAGTTSGLLGTIVSGIGSYFSTPTARYGGVIDNGQKIKGYASGGISSGPDSGYLATLHGKEAVVPLPNGNSIPVEMKNGSATNNNVVVNVSMGNSGDPRTDNTSANSEIGSKLGTLVAAAIKEELIKQKRPGGILSPYGAA